MNTDKIREALELTREILPYAITDDETQWDGEVRKVCKIVTEAIAELDKAQHPVKLLTDDEIDGIALMAVPLDTTSYDVRIAGQSIEESAPEAVRVYVRGALRYARNRYSIGAPAAGLTVEEAEQIAVASRIELHGIQWKSAPINYDKEFRTILKLRLTAAMEAKTCKP